MSYLITEKRYTECFKNHKATLKVLNDETQTLEWKEPGTRCYQIDYVFHKNMLYVSGDLGEATFSCTWRPKWDTNNGWLLDIDYLFGKLSAITGNKYTWDSDDAVNDLKDQYKDMFEELGEGKFDELTDAILSLVTEYVDGISNSNDLRNSNLPYLDIVDEDILLQYCIALKHACESNNECDYIAALCFDDYFKDFNDFWEWGYSCGRRKNPVLKYYLAGLQMSYKQLKEENTN